MVFCRRCQPAVVHIEYELEFGAAPKTTLKATMLWDDLVEIEL